MKIDEQKRKVKAMLRQAIQLTKETGSSIFRINAGINKDGYFYGYLDIADYTLWFQEDQEKGSYWRYSPMQSKDCMAIGELVDEDEIISFEEPPVKKCPDTSQSNQGKSIDEIARHHLSISEEENQ